MTTIDSLVEAQTQLEASIEEAVKAFRETNSTTNIDSINVNIYALEGEKLVTSTVSALIDGARVSRSSQ